LFAAERELKHSEEAQFPSVNMEATQIIILKYVDFFFNTKLIPDTGQTLCGTHAAISASCWGGRSCVFE
jgi:hypothetical protein